MYDVDFFIAYDSRSSRWLDPDARIHTPLMALDPDIPIRVGVLVYSLEFCQSFEHGLPIESFHRAV